MASGAGQRVLHSATSQPLGHNSNILNRGPDTALLRPSIKTSVTGVKQIIKALEAGSTEVRDYLLNEVNIVYECKCCMNMFRSLANLTAHKRSYCLERFEDVNHVFSNKTNCQSANLKTVIIEGETIDTVVPEDTLDVENYSPSLDLLKDAGIISTLEEKPLINRLLPPKKASLQSVVEKLSAKQYLEGAGNKVGVEESNTATDALCLEDISQTNKAKFQSFTTGYKYREVQALNNQISLIVGPDGKEIKNLPDRSKSPTNSEESKENDDDFDLNPTVDDNGNTVRYPCPECKKGFSKIGNVYKHLSNTHGKRKDEYTKLRQEIQDSAYVVGKTEQEGKPQKNHLHNIAVAIGLVNKNGVGMQKINKEDKPMDQPRPRGRPPKKPALELSPTDSNENGDDSDTEVSFNPESLSPESGGQVRRKRKRGEASRVPITSAWKGGAFQCVLCDRSFGTPTFLMQHYVSPHFSRELRNEFDHCLHKKKCPQCRSSFDTETKLLMHLGCTHREVHKYLPSNAKELMPGTRSPTKMMKAPMRGPAPAQDLFQKFASNLVKGGGKADKKSSPKSGSPGSGSIPNLEDEFMT